jgi:PAS domain S-box-containing protein
MDIGLMIRIVRSQVPGLTAAGEIYLALHNPETDEITFPMAVRDGQDIEIPPRLLGSDEVSFVIRHRRPLSLGGDNPSADEVRRNLKISNGEGDVTRYLGVPLIAGDQVVGVLAVRDARTTRPFGLNDQRILTTIGTQLGAAIQNANLYDRVRNFAEDLNIRVQERTVELQQERDRIDALYRITSELGRTLDMDRVLDRALDTVSRVLDAQGGAVMLIDPMSDQLYTRAVLMPPADDNGHSGEQGVVLRKRDTGKLGSSAQRLALPVEPLAQWLIEHERALLVNNLRELPFWNASLDGADEWHSALAVVLETNEDVQGVMVFLGREPGAFTEPQLKLVSAAANQVSAAINNADLYNLIRDQAERMTTLLRAEQEEAEKSSAILEGIADGVLLADSNATIILFNGAAERILGIPRDYALGQPLSRLAALDNRSGSWVNTLSEWALNPQQSTSQELLIDRLDLGKRVVSVHASPVSSGDQFLGTVSVFRDVTKDVEVDRMKSEFISNVSHELRTPMTSIKGYADLLLMGAAGQVSDVQRQFLGTIKNNADRLASLVNDLLNISRIDSGREKLKLEPVPVAEVIEQVVRNLTARESYARKPLELAVAVDPSLPHIQADRNRIMQVLTNLVDNAFNYTGAGGKIGIEAQQQAERGRVLIKVSDTGIGIPEDFQARVWNRFERNEESALVMDVAGTGLGLPIVKDLVEMHHGEVWLESEVGKGSTFFVALPIDGPDQSAPAYTRQVSETAANTSGSVEG